MNLKPTPEGGAPSRPLAISAPRAFPERRLASRRLQDTESYSVPGRHCGEPSRLTVAEYAAVQEQLYVVSEVPSGFVASKDVQKPAPQSKGLRHSGTGGEGHRGGAEQAHPSLVGSQNPAGSSPPVSRMHPAYLPPLPWHTSLASQDPRRTSCHLTYAR